MNAPKTDPLYVVMVDDDREDVYSMRRAFSACAPNLRFEHVSSGAALFELLAERSDSERTESYPDLILLDLNLPRMSGHEILAKLRAKPDPALVPVVVLSTSDSEADIIRSYKSGANAFFTKPATFEETRGVAESIARFWQTPGLKRAGRASLED